jgi:competence ComEA-like helix-hairpin-helix protein
MTRPTVVLCASVLAAGLVAAQGIDPASLPAGPERELLFRVCGECHDVDNAVAQRHTPSEWRAVVDDMIARGAQAADADVKTLVRYLSQHAGRVNVNRASADDLQDVLGVTKEQAEAVVAFRKSHGDFRSLEELKQVAALDARVIDERKDRIVFSGQ